MRSNPYQTEIHEFEALGERLSTIAENGDWFAASDTDGFGPLN
jgi:hypothetical protein